MKPTDIEIATLKRAREAAARRAAAERAAVAPLCLTVCPRPVRQLALFGVRS